ncbi:MAG: hypothetical protein Athens071426_604 [Parcubacteria group bacterium Athens0714_26]|nr:MAG: hypothetical protein Athens071426_604 [Parcubacteria group bacterium Athens0714_26]
MQIHFIGIGGIGISALAQYYLKTGHQVSGSDLASSETTDLLKKFGAKIVIGPHKAGNLPKEVNLVIYSPAIQITNPELKQAYKIQDIPISSRILDKVGTRYKIQIMSYPQAVGELTKKYFTIAISGSHGKSTTTALISVILMKAGLDPTVIIGTKLKEFGNSNFRFGSVPASIGVLNRRKSASIASRSRKTPTVTPSYAEKLSNKGILVIEADEYKSSFLNYWPKIIVLTNLEYEHPDYFENFRHYLRVFKEYIKHLEFSKNINGTRTVLVPLKDGVLVANKDDRNVTNMTRRLQSVTKYYSIKQPEANKLRKTLKIPGEHNISNALAALTVARTLKIPDKVSFKALSEYRGAWRRFEGKEYKIPDTPHQNKFGTGQARYKIRIISDYAHHPTQVRATIAAAREEYPKRKIWAVFQPHQYLRTYYLFKDYIQAFDEADEVVLTEIYAVSGRENKEIMRKLSSKDLVLAIQKRFKRIGEKVQVHFLKDYRDAPAFLKSRVKNSDVVIVMGAGDIYKIISNF